MTTVVAGNGAVIDKRKRQSTIDNKQGIKERHEQGDEKSSLLSFLWRNPPLALAITESHSSESTTSSCWSLARCC